ncbi:unnamed protein product [Penicillium viridicatum]
MSVFFPINPTIILSLLPRHAFLAITSFFTRATSNRQNFHSTLSNRPLHSSRITTEVREMPPNQPTNTPSDIHKWKAAARRKGVNLKISVHTRGPFKSGSKVVEEEFRLLKAIWPKVLPTDKWQVQTQLGLETQFRKATEHLEGIPAFNDYLVAIRNKTLPKNSTLGIFWLPYEQQYRVCQLLQSDTAEQERAYGNNEELINSSLLSFLQIVCATHPDVDSDWNPARVHLTFDFRKVKTDKENKKLDSNVFSLSCMVDGFLESRSTFRSQAIVEAKARERLSHEPEVSWQETIEMVTALLNDHPKRSLQKDRVTVFSQNGTEMYILNAVHTDGYSQHMKGDKQKPFVKQDEFLRIHKYGPYLIYQEKDMEYFAKLALAVVLRASEEEVGRN